MNCRTLTAFKKPINLSISTPSLSFVLRSVMQSLPNQMADRWSHGTHALVYKPELVALLQLSACLQTGCMSLALPGLPAAYLLASACSFVGCRPPAWHWPCLAGWATGLTWLAYLPLACCHLPALFTAASWLYGFGLSSCLLASHL